MNLGFLMVILTLLEGGQMSAAFVNTQTLEECEQRASAVRSILEKGSVDIKEMVCRSSTAQFEPFTHGAADEGGQHRYIIAIDDSIAHIESVATCDSANAAEDGQYCVFSNQKLLSKNQ